MYTKDASHNDRPDDSVVISVINLSIAMGILLKEPISPTALKLRKVIIMKTNLPNHSMHALLPYESLILLHQEKVH